MREISTEIEIEAAPGDVWRVLLEPPGGKAMTFRPTVVRVDESREFRWLGHLLFPGLFDGEHIFELEDLGGRTRFVQREQFRGVLAGAMLRMIGDRTRHGFVAMNEALRDRVERPRSQAESVDR